MALNVKQIVAIGLGLGIATAFGYHFLTRPSSNVSVQPGYNQLHPIDGLDLEPMALPQPEPVPPQPLPSESDGAPELAPYLSDAKRPQRDSQTEFSMPEYQPAAEQLELSAEMSEPLTNSGVDPVSGEDSDELFDLADLALEGGDTFDSSGDAVDPTSDIAATNPSSAMSEVSNPTAPVEMLPATSGNQITASQADLPQVILQTQSTPQSQPKAATAKANTSSETRRGWKTNPFVTHETSATTRESVVESIDAGAALQMLPGEERQDGSAAPLYAQVASNSSAELAGNQAQMNLQPQSTDLYLASPDSRPTKSVLSGSPEIQTRPANSVLSLMDPSRERAAGTESGTPPSRDFNMPGPESTAIPLSEADAQQAVHHIEYGKELSRRGAGFSAREEFLKAMQVLAGANDRRTGSTARSTALRRALLIINEAEDFAAGSAEQQIQLNVANVIQSHRCNILSAQEAEQMTSSQAIDYYFATAQKELDLAGGRSAVSAEVFYCLGKLNSALPSKASAKSSVDGPLETAKSVVFHQAALMSDPSHHRSANELGVLFAKNGRLQQAKLLFERSLMAQPHPQTWQNLATTHRRLGEHDFARRAENEYQLIAQAPANSDAVVWKPISQFNAEANITPSERVATLPGSPTGGDNSALKPPAREKRSLTERLKDLF